MVALDAAAALRDQRTLARLARDLVEYGLAGRADELLALVVRRRLPRVIAELLTVLDFDGMSALTRTLVGEYPYATSQNLGKISAVALHSGFHLTLENELQGASSIFLCQRPGRCRSKICCDGPTGILSYEARVRWNFAPLRRHRTNRGRRCQSWTEHRSI